MSDRLRVAYLTSVYPRASDSFIRTEIAELRAQGVEVIPVAIRRPEQAQLVSDELAAEASRTCYLLGSGRIRLLVRGLVHAITNPLRFSSAARLMFQSHAPGLANRFKQLIYLVEAVALVRLLRSKGIQHVHNHIGENSASVAMAAAAMSELTYSLTIHGPGIFFHPRQWALGEKIARSSFTACITKFCTSQCMIFTSPEAWEKLRLVRCGVDARFLRQQSAAPADRPRFVCVGRLCPEKGHLILIQAIKRLAVQGISIEMHLIGDGESRGDIEEYVNAAGLEDNIILHGWQPAENIRSQLEAARALVLPSFAEGLPVVFMEALAMSRPVVSTRVAGIPELIEDRVHGWLIEPADVDSLCQALREAAECSVQEIQRMGQLGRESVERFHNGYREAAKLKELFAAVLLQQPLPSQPTLESVANPRVTGRCA